MRKTRLPAFVFAVLTSVCSQVLAFEPRPLPEFTGTDPGHWINSAPLRGADLRGQVLLIDVWTFGCWNCYRSFPWLKALEARLADHAFQVVGIHSPATIPPQTRSAISTTATMRPTIAHPKAFCGAPYVAGAPPRGGTVIVFPQAAQGPVWPAYRSSTLVWCPQWGQVNGIGIIEPPIVGRQM